MWVKIIRDYNFTDFSNYLLSLPYDNYLSKEISLLFQFLNQILFRDSSKTINRVGIVLKNLANLEMS